MNEMIMRWSSEAMYENRLIAHSSAADRGPEDLVSEDAIESTQLLDPLIFIDTAGSLMYEDIEEEVGKNESKFNIGEADLVIQVIKEILESGIEEQAIGVISPYSA